MERNTIEQTALTITIVDENIATKFTVPDPVCTGGIKEVPAIEKVIQVQNLITLLWTLNLWVPTILSIVQ